MIRDNHGIGYTEKKWCKQCSRILPVEYQEDICPACKEINLFSEVKEYIRSNDVKEMDVAEHFGLPVKKVRQWIKEGRIQYRGQDSTKAITAVYCQMCGKPINFGTLCTSCHRASEMKGTAQFTKSEDSRMRFLDDEKKH